MKALNTLLWAIAFFSSLPSFAGTFCNIRDFGAKGDGTTKDTAAIQAAINHCPAGGIVLLPSGGTYLSGTIRLKSEITLRVEPGATLKGSFDDADYPDLMPPTQNSQLNNCRKALIYGEGLANVTIEGAEADSTQSLTSTGVIDGNGANHASWQGPEKTRPMAVFIALSDHVTIRNVQVINSGMWSVVHLENIHVLVDSIRVHSTWGPTRDGIDVVDCSQVLIQNSDIETEDDSICLKSGSTKGVHQVVVKNIRIRNSGVANALKLGTASTGAFEGIHFESIQIDATRQAAMAVESVDGSDIRDVTFKKINFSNAATAIFVLLGQRSGSHTVGSIENIAFQDIHGTVNTNWGSAISGTIIGDHTHRIQGLDFQNVHIMELNSGGLNKIPSMPPEYNGQYPDPRMPGWQPLPAFGFYFRHITGLKLLDSDVMTAPSTKTDPRPAMRTDD